MAKKKKTFDFNDLRKEMKEYSVLGETLDKTEFGNLNYYLHSGNYMLNALLSGTIFGGYPGGFITELGGEKSTGKTFAMMNACESAATGQVFDMDGKRLDFKMPIVYYDTEAAVNKQSVIKSFKGIDPTQVQHEPMSTVEDIKIHLAKTLKALIDNKRKGFEIPKFLFIIDSLGNLASDKEVSDAELGEKKADMTRAKANNSLFRIIPIKLKEIDATLIYANHVYDNTSGFGSGVKGKGGKGREYIASILVQLFKALDRDITKNGVIVRAKIGEKNRFAIPKEIRFHIDYRHGMNQYIGLPFLLSKAAKFPLKEDYFVDIHTTGWFDYGIQFGTIINQKEFEKIAKKEPSFLQEIKATQYELNGETLYFVAKIRLDACKLTGKTKIAIKHLGKNINISEFFTDDVFTSEVLQKIDDIIIKPLFSYGDDFETIDITVEDVEDDELDDIVDDISDEVDLN